MEVIAVLVQPVITRKMRDPQSALGVCLEHLRLQWALRPTFVRSVSLGLILRRTCLDVCNALQTPTPRNQALRWRTASATRAMLLLTVLRVKPAQRASTKFKWGQPSALSARVARILIRSGRCQTSARRVRLGSILRQPTSSALLVPQTPTPRTQATKWRPASATQATVSQTVQHAALAQRDSFFQREIV